MAYSVTYTQSISSNSDPVVQPSPVELVLTVTGVQDFTDFGVFVWMRMVATGELVFSHVATPVDIDRYNFAVIGEHEFVRLGNMRMRFNRADQAEDAVTQIQGALQQLCIDMQLLSDFDPAVIITVSA